ncbi:MAG: hypothetical protein R3C41_01380 [Calditrichia bacterium]|nr:hypothetical protein [Calditrichota bacterium]MCB0288056.1 hypothetical protein [Calditrichota bacterium]MCB9066435.1 hypothetical protein [Calditrichia bacterium]
MLKLYLACLLFGGLFIIISLFFGADADAEADVDVDVDTDIDVDTDVEMDADAAEVEVSGEGTVEAIKFLSFRNFVFFVAFFGLTGSLLTWIGSNFLLTFGAAITLGFVAATVMHRVMKQLAATEVGETLNLDRLVGMPAKVTINVSRDHRGKVSLEAVGQRMQLLAQTAEESERDEFSVGESVYILHVKNGIAFVVEEAFINSATI